jgi:outer membrane protein insertion porin family
MTRVTQALWSLTLGALLLPACSAAPPGPSEGTAPQTKPSAAALEVTEDRVCDAEAFKPLRVSAGTPPPETARGPVTEVIIDGFDGKQDELRATLSSGPGEPVNPSKVAKDIETLWATGRFQDISVELRTTGSGTSLAFVVSPRPTTGKLFFRGVEQLAKHQVDTAVQLEPGEPFDPQQLTHTVARLKEAYVAAGYWFATVEAHELRTDALHLCLQVQEGTKVTIDQWLFHGAKLVNDEQLRALMDSRGGTVNVADGVYLPKVWGVDTLRIQAMYFDNGFLTAKVGAPELDVSQDKRKVTVTVRVEEGVVYRVGKIRFSGDALAQGQPYGSAITTKSGDVFSRSKVLEDLARIREFHEKTGTWTPQFEVTPVTRLDTDKSLVDIDFQLQ